MKILYHHRIASKDGQAVHVEEMIDALRELSCDVIVVAPPGWSDSEFGGGGGATATLRAILPRAASEVLELAYNWIAYRRLSRAVRLHRPDVVYERHNLYLLAGTWIRRKFKLPFLLEVNSPLAIERGRHGGLGLPYIAQKLETAVWKSADAVLPVTTVLANILEAHGVPRDRLHVIPNGINPAMFAGAPSNEEAKRRLGCEGRLILGFTGFVRPWHGLDVILDYIATSRHPETTLLVVGDGPARESLVEQAARLGISDRIRFSGIVERARIPELVAAFDIALQPASTPYASPLKLFEYFALGLAVVAPRQANLMEIIVDGENGLLFDPENRPSLYSALDRLIADPSLRSRIGSAARGTIHDRNMTWQGNAQRVKALADLLTEESQAASG